ncbi:MAG: methylated-DNA--[protein]-cysteine S-methyltransferase [Eubacteriales bacterium]|nr:methylated-DNA--[protein]-cysteine S-methyltransferase [Eubacteriales bacterium]
MPQQNKQDFRKEAVTLATPIGVLTIMAIDDVVCSIGLAKPEEKVDRESRADHPLLNQAAQELREYFAGARTQFTFPMQAEGTAFQQDVWDALKRIPFGKTMSYGEIAAQIGNPKAARAVGMACNRNPIMIAVPCHRVVGAKGALVGYAYGTGMKHFLLDLEQPNQ